MIEAFSKGIAARVRNPATIFSGTGTPNITVKAEEITLTMTCKVNN